MDSSIITVTAAIAALAAFLILITALKYAISDAFIRTRLIMTAFVMFIVTTLTLSFWQYALMSLWFTVPAALLGVAVGYFAGVKAAQERLLMQGLEDYMAHFAHVHAADVKKLQWWSLINFYSIAGALLLINLVGLSSVIFAGREGWAMAACVFGAFLLGSVVPYLVHLWTINPTQNSSKITSEA